MESILESMDPVELLKLELEDLRRQLRIAERELGRARMEELTLERIRNGIFGLLNDPPKIPAWTMREWNTTADPLVPVLALSDVHFGEQVDPKQINGINEYCISIAKRRLKLLVDKTIHICKHHINGTLNGVVLAILGDMFSGDIHKELGESNECTTPEGLIDLLTLLISMITALADAFGHVEIVAVIGNHGRLDEKPRAKDAVFRNWDWLLYCMAESMMKGDTRITWNVSPSVDAMFTVFGTKFLATHGDQFRGGSGISGLMAPLLIGDARKRKRQASIGNPYDYLLMGHWHQRAQFHGVIVNGSVKGYDEYAHSKNFPADRPEQQLFMVRKDGRICYWAPVFLDDEQEEPCQTKA